LLVVTVPLDEAGKAPDAPVPVRLKLAVMG
jgi:hypothetical protein